MTKNIQHKIWQAVNHGEPSKSKTARSDFLHRVRIYEISKQEHLEDS